MDDEMGPDLLSDLPSSIIETILTLVPIRDAIKTSVLSTKWRYRWTSIPHLFFTDECVDGGDEIGHKESLIKFITFTLLLHKGPITTFKIFSWMLKHCAEVDQWILFLSRNNLRELALELEVEEWFTVPTCLFSCTNLTHLELYSSYPKLPPSFKGFLCLRTLDLQPVLMSPHVERLISSCPLLENIKLNGYCYDLTIYAPNLKYLYLGDLPGLRIQNSPFLKDMSITLVMDYDDDSDAEEDFEKSPACNFSKVLGNVPVLERLVGRQDFTQYMSVGLDLWKPHVTFNQLKVISLEVSFKDRTEIMVVLKLIINSPFLQDLYIRGLPITTNDVDSPDDEVKLLEIEYPSCTFKLLKNVKMSNMCAMPLEIKLIKYLLENSPTLEKISITP